MSNDLLGYNIPRLKIAVKADNNTYWQSCQKFIEELDNKVNSGEQIKLTYKQENWLEKIENDLAQK